MTQPAPGLRALPRTAALWATLGLCGCSAAVHAAELEAPPTEAAATAAQKPTAPAAVKVEIVAVPMLKALLERHLDLVRLGLIDRADVDAAEWSRLIDATPSQVRELLQTEGYFNPVVSMTRAPAASGPEDVRLTVDAGPQARVERVTLEFEGEIERAGRSAASVDRLAVELMVALQREWPLPAGGPFRNAVWNAAKQTLLTRLRAAGYASATWSGTKADVDAENNSVRLFLVADSGPLFRFGQLDIDGLAAHDAATVLNLVAADSGAPVTEALLLDTQDRLQKSGLFESIAVALDTDPAQAGAARITVRLREAPLQTWTFGLGVSANTGPRASVDHVWRRVFGSAALARNKFEYGSKRKAWDGEISTHAGAGLYRNLLGGAVEELKSDTDTVLSQRLRLGRTQDGQRIERLLFVEGERSLRKTSNDSVRTTVVAVSLNYHGVWRDLDSIVLPTRGISLKGQLGGGSSHGSNATPGPFARLYLRLTGYQPLGRNWYGQARVELGQVFLQGDRRVPESQQFRAGGDDSVRGYAYRSLGPLVDGAVGSGNALFSASTEVATPISSGLPSLWGAVFVDLGNAANDFSSLHPALGAGVGLRWRSPVGPLRLDWAYGRETRKSRVHFSVGIAF